MSQCCTTTALYSYGALSERFTGKERDGETGLDYFGARYFSANAGRFMSADAPFADQHAADPQSWNLYSYVRNNPLRYTDPTGRCLRPNETLASCGDYLLGGAQAIGNIPSDIVNAPNRLTNMLISPFTEFRFPDAIPTSFQAANADQAQGMEAMQVALVVTGVGEAATAGSVSRTASAVSESAPIGGRLGNATTRGQNASVAASLEGRGFTITGGGGKLPEEYMRPPGGGPSGGTFVDVTAVRDGRTVRVQTVDTRTDGITPSTREARSGGGRTN